MLKSDTIIPFVRIAVGSVRATCRGAARSPSLHSRPAPTEKSKLDRQALHNYVPRGQRKTPATAGLHAFRGELE